MSPVTAALEAAAPKAALGSEGCLEEVPLESDRRGAYALKHEVFWAPFSELLVVSLVSRHHRSPVSERIDAVKSDLQSHALI